MSVLYGRNPVIEALKKGDSILKIYLQRGVQGPKIRQIQVTARKKQIPVVEADAGKLKQLTAGGNHQGVAALLSQIAVVPLERLLSRIAAQSAPPLLVLVDRIQDPHNLGAIIRSAEVLGADGVLVSTRETAPLTDTVLKTSAGAALNIPLCRVSNLARIVPELKSANFWVYGTVPRAGKSLWAMDFSVPTALLIGNEEKGIRPQLQKMCDDLFTIPQKGKTDSLNASVAAGIVLAEVLRQRSGSRGSQP